MTLFKIKGVLSKNLELSHTKRLSKLMRKVKEVNKKMEIRTTTHHENQEFSMGTREPCCFAIKELCDRCFKDIEVGKTIYKYGSAVYCEKCHEEIEKEILEDMQKYISNFKCT